MLEIANVRGEHFEQVALTQDDDMIERLTTRAAEKALTAGAHP